jgi:hypothetical protein
MTPANAPYFVQIVPGGCYSQEIRGAWDLLLKSSPNSGNLERNPRFYDHLLETRREGSLAVATVRDDTGSIVGVAPLLLMRLILLLDVAGRVLGKTSLSGVRILGSQPLFAAAEPVLYDRFFEALTREFPERGIIGMESVPTASPLWRFIQHSRLVRESFFVHIPDGIRTCHSIPLPATFEEYLGKFNAKKRYNLKRQMRMLREHGGGHLELHRMESRDQVPDFIADTSVILRACKLAGPWQPYWAPAVDVVECTSLADRGLWLCYVLTCGDRPIGAALGKIDEQRYYLNSLMHDPAFDRFSPGATLLHLLVEDLIRRRSVDLIDLGFGEPAYQHSSTNVTEPRATVFLLRRSFANQMRRWGHAGFKQLVNQFKLRSIESKAVPSRPCSPRSMVER